VSSPTIACTRPATPGSIDGRAALANPVWLSGSAKRRSDVEKALSTVPALAVTGSVRPLAETWPDASRLSQ
jgi:hypothetical protein